MGSAIQPEDEDMKIGIVGAGQIGGTLTRRLTALGHKIFVANSRGPETLSNLAAETGATAVSVPEAVRDVDLIVVTIPQKNILNLPAGLFADTPERVVVVDTGNYYPRQRDGRIEAIEAGMPESRWVEQQLGRPVIKAFNVLSRTIYGRQVIAVGQNPRAARLAGVPVERTRAITYIMCAVLAGVCGYLVAGFSGGAALNMGQEYLLSSIAVVVIGGTSVNGGYANVPGLWGAALFLFLLVTMLNTWGFGAGARLVLTGLVIIAVIVAASGQKRPG